MSDRRNIAWVAVVAPIAFALVAYRGALEAAFVFDDFLFWQFNCWQVDGFLKIPHLIEGACEYRPVRYLSLAIDYQLYGDDPAGYHLTNVLLHGVATGLVFVAAQRLLKHRMAASLAVLIWALHPVHTDVVTYVAGRRDVMCAIFFLLAYNTWPRKFTRPLVAALRANLAVGFFFVALSSKEMAATLPVVLLLSAVTLENRGRLVALWKSTRGSTKVGLALPAFIAFGLSVGWVLHRGILHSFTDSKLWGGALWHHVLTVAATYSEYLKQVFAPLWLHGDYSGYQLPSGLGDIRVIIGVVVLLVVWVGGLASLSRRPFLAFGLLWFGITMLPVSQIIPHHELLAEHYLYIPLMGPAIALGRGIELGLSGRFRTPVLVGVSVVCAFSIAIITDRNRDFLTEKAFAEAIIEHDPHTIRGYITLSHALAVEEEWPEVIDALEIAISRMEPTNRFFHEAQKDLLTAYASMGDFERATRQAQIMMRAFPTDGYGFQVMGTLLARMGRYEEALEFQRHGVELQSSNVEGRLHLAITLMSLKQFDEAEGHIRFAMDQWPNRAYVQEQWALLAAERQEAREASLRPFVRLGSTEWLLWAKLLDAHLLRHIFRHMGLAQWREVIRRYERVLRIEPMNIIAVEQLIGLHRMFGDSDRACYLYWVLRGLREDVAAQRPLCPPPAGEVGAPSWTL